MWWLVFLAGQLVGTAAALVYATGWVQRWWLAWRTKRRVLRWDAQQQRAVDDGRRDRYWETGLPPEDAEYW